ncbi:ankyrin repeat protein [Achlya hypogyna]|uniref:Ankyrin repeat protein n=1 Tax=Achlya hypogyna TaxID=1202772 RepID=A0A1V9Z0A0_ACHHY|nr:ankyrin repeat protein [Achlya hypogyna]
MDNDSVTALLHLAINGDAAATASLLSEVKLRGVGLQTMGTTLLVLAVQAHDLDAIETLLAHGLDPNAWDSQEITPLIAATQKGYSEVVEMLLRHHVNVNTITPCGVTALQEACRFGHVAMAERLLELGADTEACGEDGVTALCLAFDNNDIATAELLHRYKANPNVSLWGNPLFLLSVDIHSVDFMKLLVEVYDIDVNQTDANGNTALMLATRRGFNDIVDYLLPKSDVNLVAHPGYSALAIAAAAGNLPLVELLVAHGAKVEPDSTTEEAPLEAASAQGRVAVVEYLVPLVRDVDRMNAEGTTALYSAVFNGMENVLGSLCRRANLDLVMKNGATYLCAACFDGNLPLVEGLLRYGANPNAADLEGNTPIMHALLNKHLTIVQRLLEEKVDLNVQNLKGEPSLFKARSAASLKLLLDAGADTSITRPNGCTVLAKVICLGNAEMASLLLPFVDVNAPIMRTTALRLAVETRNERLVKLLLDHGADVDQAAENGRTALHLAAQLGDATLIELLLEHTKAIDQTFPDGCTALSTAVEFGTVEAVAALIRHGANVHHVNESGLTLLHVASAVGRTEVVPLLLAAGVDVAAVDEQGWSAFALAVDKNHVAVVSLLLPLVDPNAMIVSSIAPGLIPYSGAPFKSFYAGFGVIHMAYDVADDPTMLGALIKSPVVNINLRDAARRHGLTALHGACARGLERTVQLLLSHPELDINLPDEEGNTALHLACRNGHVPVVGALLASPAVDVTARNKTGEDCVAMADGQPAVLALLAETT